MFCQGVSEEDEGEAEEAEEETSSKMSYLNRVVALRPIAKGDGITASYIDYGFQKYEE